MEMEGLGGELRCGWRSAAALGRWQLSRNSALGSDHSTITADYLKRDDFLMLQRPLDLELRLGDRRLRWPAALLDGDTIHVKGQPEEVRWPVETRS